MSNIIPTLKYIWLTIKHKAFVFRAGIKTGAPIWRLLIHDWTKFTPSEAPHYGRQFFGDGGDPLGFAQAWNHHQKHNPHHWEYWFPITGHDRGGYPGMEPLPMPDWAVKEMVADWYGASRAYEGSWPYDRPLHEWRWFTENFPKIRKQMHPATQDRVLGILSRKFAEDVLPYQRSPANEVAA